MSPAAWGGVMLSPCGTRVDHPASGGVSTPASGAEIKPCGPSPARSDRNLLVGDPAPRPCPRPRILVRRQPRRVVADEMLRATLIPDHEKAPRRSTSHLIKAW